MILTLLISMLSVCRILIPTYMDIDTKIDLNHMEDLKKKKAKRSAIIIRTQIWN